MEHILTILILFLALTCFLIAFICLLLFLFDDIRRIKRANGALTKEEWREL